MYRPDIDGLRAVAVVAVILYHSGIAKLPGGYLGVDVFFVISGYVITSSIVRDIRAGAFTFAGFYARRARRLIPSIVFVLGFTLLAGAWILTPKELLDLAHSALAALFFSSNIYFWREAEGGYFAQTSEYLPLLHTWSLAVEEQFYLLAPITLILVIKLFSKPAFYLAVVGVVASLGIATISVQVAPAAGFFLLPARAWALGLGVAIALLPRLVLPRATREFVAAVGLCAITLSFFAFGDGDAGLSPNEDVRALRGPPGLLGCLGAAAIIAAGVGGESVVSKVLALRPMVFVGLMSYALYLWHWPLLALARRRADTVDLPLHVAIALVIVACLLAYLSWRFVENPIRFSHHIKPLRVLQLTCVSFAFMIGVWVIVVMSSGFPQRFSPEALTALAAESDRNPRQAECFGQPSNAEPCSFGRKGSEAKMLLWGDSHADALFAAVDAVATDLQIRGVFAGSGVCPPLVGVNTNYSRMCADYNKSVLNTIDSHPTIRVVVLHARWPMYATGVDTTGGIIELYQADSARVPVASRERAYRDGLEQTIEELRRRDKIVLIIGSLPEFPWSVPRTMFRQLHWGDPVVGAPTKVTASERGRLAEQWIANEVDDETVFYLSMETLICPGECLMMADGKPIYYDEDHLTASFSRAHVSVYLKEWLARPEGRAVAAALSGGEP